MPTPLTMHMVLGFIPDKNAEKASKKLANATQWSNIGTNNDAIWGEIKGSGKKPYQVGVDLRGAPTGKCSCSSRKHPCKHVIALMLVYVQEPGQFAASQQVPTWLQDWLDKRTAKQKQATTPKPVDREEQAKRHAKRQQTILAGLDEFDLWLRDLMRAGLVTLQTKDDSFYLDRAKRLVDAKAPGLGDRIELLADLPKDYAHTVDHLLRELGQLHLISQSFRHYDTLPTPMQADLRNAIGWTIQENELDDTPTINDQWVVLGTIQYTPPARSKKHLLQQRIWLHGIETQRAALLLDTKPKRGVDNFRHLLQVGESFRGDVVFFPSGHPLRAIVRTRGDTLPGPDTISAYDSYQAMLDKYAAALSQNPWITHFPAAVRDVIPTTANGSHWAVVDDKQHTVPLDSAFTSHWELFTLSGGHPITLFGEWNGSTFLPLTAYHHGEISTLVDAHVE